MNYYVFNILPEQYSTEQNEILMALLSDLPFDTFEETETGINAYISEALLTKTVENQLTRLGKKQHFNFTKTFIPYENWNVLWESNFEPIQVDDFVAVRAEFHPHTEGVQFDLEINPKMAFGTGHHETTYMMMQQMRDIDFKNKKVLDYGCGTGILAILASKLEAKEIEAVDIDLPAYESTIENSEINNVFNIKAFQGRLDIIKSTQFDVILANINRNVILESLESLKSMLVPKGILVISGFLKEDENVMEEALEKQGLAIHKTLHRGNWLSMYVIN